MPPLTPARWVSFAVALAGLLCCSSASASPRSECQAVCKTAQTTCLDACRLEAGGDEIVDGLIKATMVACQKACKEAWRDCRTSCQDLPGAPKGPDAVGGTAPPPPPPPPQGVEPAAPPEEGGAGVEAPVDGGEATGGDDPGAVTGFLALALGGLCCGSGLLALVAGIVFLVVRRRPAGQAGGSGGSPGGGA